MSSGLVFLRPLGLRLLAAVDAAAATPGEQRAVWVTGPPGVGKTGLAVEAAHRMRDRFPDGQLLVRLNGYAPNAPATTVSDALTQLLRELGVPPEQIPATDAHKAALYQAELYGTKRLVVLDNAASPEQVRLLLPVASGCFAIVTSRQDGEVGAGRRIRLEPLPPADAASLFTAFAKSPARTNGRADEVAEVVRRCGYLPMPVLVAAALFARHDRWPLEHLLRLLAESGPWSADGAAAVRVSYQQLGHRQREVFGLLGHVPGPDIDVRAAAALVGDDLAAARAVLDDLHGVCLLEEVTPDRYRMLDPLRDFAAAEAPGAPDALLRLLDYYLVTLTGAVGVAYSFDRALLPTTDRTSAQSPTFTDAEGARAWITAERDNLVAAVHHAAGHGLPDHAWRLAVLIWRHLHTTSQFEDWMTTLDEARKCAAPTDDQAQALVLLRLSTAHARLGRHEEALDLAELSLPHWKRLSHPHGEAAALCAIAIPLSDLGRHDEAITHLTAALAKFDEVADARGRGHALSMLGYLNETHGDLATALDQHLTAVAILREIGHTQGLAHALNNLGSVQQGLSLLADALATHAEAHALAVEAGDQCVAAYALNYTANVHRLRGDLTGAMRFHDLARTTATDVRDADLHTHLFLDRAATTRAAGDAAAACRTYRSALDLATGTGNRTHEAHAHRGIAQTLHTQGDHVAASTHWDAAENLYDALDLPEAADTRAERAALTCPCR
ncbi:hypothetical protein GCM10023148_53480 [Actinokineospora soli]